MLLWDYDTLCRCSLAGAPNADRFNFLWAFKTDLYEYAGTHSWLWSFSAFTRRSGSNNEVIVAVLSCSAKTHVQCSSFGFVILVVVSVSFPVLPRTLLWIFSEKLLATFVSQPTRMSIFLPHDAVHKRGLCRDAVSVSLSVCPSRSVFCRNE